MKNIVIVVDWVDNHKTTTFLMLSNPYHQAHQQYIPKSNMERGNYHKRAYLSFIEQRIPYT